MSHSKADFLDEEVMAPWSCQMTNIDTRSSGLESLSENLGLMSQAKEKNNSLHMLSKIQNEIKSEDIHHQCRNPKNAAKWVKN